MLQSVSEFYQQLQNDLKTSGHDAAQLHFENLLQYLKAKSII